MKHLNIHIHGEVQGVLFRSAAQKKATELGVTGFIRNEMDGSIYIEAEGEKWPLAEFVHWCGDGPPLAKVERVEQEERIKTVGFGDFKIHQ